MRRLSRCKKLFLAVVLLTAALTASVHFGLPVSGISQVESFLAKNRLFEAILPESRRFDLFTEDVFRTELSGNTLSMHYTISDLKACGLDKAEVTLGNPDPDGRKQYLSTLENYLSSLQKFKYEELTQKQQLTYDIFRDYLQTELSAADMLLYEEPLGPTLGIQAQLPVLLAEYPFRTKKDIEDYLALLSQIPDYFQSILSFENTRSANGLFMSDECAQEVISQCQEFIANPSENYLLELFDDRIDPIKNLTADEKISYKNRNSQLLQSCVIPAYQRLIDGLTAMLGTGTNSQGLYYYPSGTAYYKYLVHSNVGDDRPIEEIESAVKKQMVADYSEIQKLLAARGGGSSTQSAGSSGSESEASVSDTSGQTVSPAISENVSSVLNISDQNVNPADSENMSAESDSYGQDINSSDLGNENAIPSSNPENNPEASASFSLENGTDTAASSSDELTQAAWAVEVLSPAVSSDPASMLEDLRQKITQDFPLLPNVSCKVKYVHESLQKYLSPAFYLTPAIDDYKNNVIYINPAGHYNDLELYTTLAHEGYPGHLFQSVYFNHSEPDLLRAILGPDGYVEGWATYVEMYAYGLWTKDPQLASLGQRNRSFMLGLASLLDIGIHYRGYTLEQVESFLNQLGFESSTAASLYRSILESPANYLQYYVGYLNFNDLKDYARELMGNDFSLKKYHTMILDAGPAPFSILRTYLEQRCQAQ